MTLYFLVKAFGVLHPRFRGNGLCGKLKVRKGITSVEKVSHKPKISEERS